MEKAFTLAEVLITIAIISVVATMTLPTLIKKTPNWSHIPVKQKCVCDYDYTK